MKSAIEIVIIGVFQGLVFPLNPVLKHRPAEMSRE